MEGAALRLVTWNCCGKTQLNVPWLLGLQPDVAVLVEASARLTADVPGVTWLSKAPYSDSPKHIAALARAPWRVADHPLADSVPGWVLPVAVDGPTPFTLLAVHTIERPGWPKYPAQVAQLVSDVLPMIEGDLVVAGDFNVPIQKTVRAHAMNDEALRAMGLRNAFLAANDIDVDAAYSGELDGQPGVALQTPTYFHHRRADRGFHIDHVYVPETWLDGGLRVAVGAYDEWVATGRSDHVPVTVDLAPRT